MIFPLALAAAGLGVAPSDARGTCGKLLALRLDRITINAADAVPEGAVPGAATSGSASNTVRLPAYCRVRAVATPVRGSRIGFELWLPRQGWNGRLKMFGNGGYSSALPLARLAEGLSGGYAVTATDTGHQGDDPEFAVGFPESITDWGHRAVHLTAKNAKTLLQSYYGRPATHSYFEGCSTGGQQGLMSAQRYPADFDGIIVGAPGHNRTRLNIGFLWQFVSNRRRGSSDPVLTADKLPLLTRAALAQCGNDIDRARGYLGNPFACRVDLAELKCRAGHGADCLTDEQIAVAAKMYDGARHARTGAQLYPPWLPGSETGWAHYWADPRNSGQPMRANFFRFWAFRDPAWDWQSFDFDRSLTRIDPSLSRKIDAIDPDLSDFARRGGKLIHYHGLADAVVSPWDSAQYYDAAQRHTKARGQDFARLFFAPGMAHCGGGPGPEPINLQQQIEQWVEQDVAPRRIATEIRMDGRAGDDLCPYPAIGSLCVSGRRAKSEGR